MTERYSFSKLIPFTKLVKVGGGNLGTKILKIILLKSSQKALRRRRWSATSQEFGTRRLARSPEGLRGNAKIGSYNIYYTLFYINVFKNILFIHD